MKDNLKDLVAYTHGIEGIDTVKITGTDTSTIRQNSYNYRGI